MRLMGRVWRRPGGGIIPQLPLVARVMALSLLAACSPDTDIEPAKDQDSAASISVVTEEGPIKMTLTLAPKEPRLGDPLTLTLTVESAPEVAVEMPAFGEALGRFSIVNFTPKQELAADGSAVASQRYTLQAPMSGKQRIPALRIEYLDRRQNPDNDQYRELLSDTLSVTVASVLPEGEVLDELRPARAALAETPDSVAKQYWPLALALVVLTGGGLLGFAWWQRYAEARARMTAYDRALQRLSRLEEQGLPDATAADAWYVELSDIVRRYLEDQYGLRAPELTSEEFLQEAQRSEAMTPVQRELMPVFLEQCDRVKFAAYSPEQSESGEALALARRFFGQSPAELKR